MTPKQRLGSPRLRLFIALDLPQPFLDELIEWRRQAFAERAELRLLPRSSLHVTLAFLGYRAERDVSRIIDLSFASAAGPFELDAQKVAGVPPRRPRLFALGLRDLDGSLRDWQAQLSEKLEHARLYEPEKRAFWPHLTVARVRDPRGGPRGLDQFAPPELPQALRMPFEPPAVRLYRSRLRRGGAIYEPLGGIELTRRGE